MTLSSFAQSYPLPLQGRGQQGRETDVSGRFIPGRVPFVRSLLPGLVQGRRETAVKKSHGRLHAERMPSGAGWQWTRTSDGVRQGHVPSRTG